MFQNLHTIYFEIQMRIFFQITHSLLKCRQNEHHKNRFNDMSKEHFNLGHLPQIQNRKKIYIFLMDCKLSLCVWMLTAYVCIFIAFLSSFVQQCVSRERDIIHFMCGSKVDTTHASAIIYTLFDFIWKEKVLSIPPRHEMYNINSEMENHFKFIPYIY